MITGFQSLTYEITPEEERIMSSVMAGLKNHEGKNNAITGKEIVERMNKMPMKKKFTDVRLRKIINRIRTHGLLPVLASSEGYYLSYDKNEILEEIKSLRERANGILTAADGLRRFVTA